MEPQPIAIPWCKSPFGIDFLHWPRAARRLWEFFRSPMHQSADRFRFRDWELARALKVGRRVIQKGLALLEQLGAIARERTWGPDGGRVIAITLRLAGPRPKEETPRPAPKAPTRSYASGANGVTARPATAAQLAAAQQKIAANAAEPPPLSEEEQAAVQEWLEQSRRRRAAAAEAAARAEARRSAPPRAKTREEMAAQLESVRNRGKPADQPA